METILFLIIAGILSSIFGRAKGNNSPGRRKPFTAKGFDDFRTKVEQHMENTSTKTRQISTGQPVAQKLQNTVENVQLMNSVPPRMPEKLVKPHESTRIEVETDGAALEKPDEKTIINGIIWAEILGEPRAKKPYIPRKG
ncbi:hypothetical protein P9D43_13040 [Neobacillus niacini]|uniref:hypothetical protein n=1 Tax=Neobacillus niacini TaxID=86668 RepID=UPI0007ABF858|nr:hypothetical protein [Neobacillus niacini]MEC1522927.1 hypothetical protein [Neobacillus niacini]